MAHSHFKILGITEDKDTEGNIRIRAQIEDFKPRAFNCNLSKASADKINALQALVGGDAMIPGREGKTADGIIYFILDQTADIIPIHTPQKIAVSSVVEIEPAATVEEKHNKPLKFG
jgi:hypothetical protein